MQITNKYESGITVVEVDGTIDTASVPEFSAQLIRALQESSGSVLLDLEKTEYMGSAGLQVMMIGQKQAIAKGIKFALCSPNDDLIDLFSVVHLKRSYTIYNTKLEALDQMGD
jgi:anti-anti-sigma factor